jgi:SAM-dependent methyltransferase
MAEIRERAATEPVRVYDAGCGFGGVALDLVNEETANHLAYLGADIHTSLPLILERLASLGRCGLLLRMDMSAPPPVPLDFHYVICRAAVHHTPDPRGSFKTLAGTLAPGGKIAISVYRKKSVCREALDDRLRAVISRLPTAEAFRVSREFTLLGRDLQQAQAMVRIEEDLPTLGIPKGEFPIQSLVYDHFLKCFYNEEFGERFSTLVNFDWYHPPYAFRYDEDEIRSWFGENGLEILDYRAIAAQHYFLARRPH